MRALSAILISILTAGLVSAADSTNKVLELDFEDAGWEILGDNHRLEPLDGRPALRLRGGAAQRTDVSFQDGTIEFDMAVSERRSFVGVQLRCQENGDSEHIYFRPHKSTLPDAIQYTPVLANNSQWQLFHDQGASAAVEFPDWQWVRVRVVVEGTRAAIFYGDDAEPALVVPRLALEPRAGFIRLSSGAPGLQPDEPDYSAFANVVVRPGGVPYDFPDFEPVESPEGLITSWELSPVFVASPEPRNLAEDLSAGLASGPWKSVSTDSDGLLLLSRHLPRPDGAAWWGAYARLVLEADPPDGEVETVEIRVGYSDNLLFALNGQPLFSGVQSYSFNFPRRQGLITLEQATVYLPLRKGRNEILIALTERFGGWGLMGRLVGAKTARVVAPSP